MNFYSIPFLYRLSTLDSLDSDIGTTLTALGQLRPLSPPYPESLPSVLLMKFLNLAFKFISSLNEGL